MHKMFRIRLDRYDETTGTIRLLRLLLRTASKCYTNITVVHMKADSVPDLTFWIAGRTGGYRQIISLRNLPSRLQTYQGC